MTFLELCQVSRQECGIQGQGPVSVENQSGLLKRVVDWVRDADLAIQAMHIDWDFLWSSFTRDTVTGSDSVVKPTDHALWDLESFAIDRGTEDGRPLGVISFQEWRNYNNVKENQEPTTLCILPDNNIALSFPADDTYEIYANYWKRPVKLETNTQEPLFGSSLDRAIIERVKMFFFEDIESFDQLKLAKDNYEFWISEMESIYLTNHNLLNQTSPEQMVVRPV